MAVVLLCRVCLRIRAGQRRNRVRIAAVGIRVASARHGDIVLPRRVGNPRDTAVHIRADRGHGVRLSAILIALCNDLIVRSRTVLGVDIELRCIGRVNSAVRAIIVAERNARAVLHQCDGTCGRADCLKRLPVKCGCTAREREHRIRRRSADIEFQLAKAHEAARRVRIPDRQFMTRAARRAARDGAGNGRTFQIDLVIRCGRTLTAEDTAHGHATLERNLIVRGCAARRVAANDIVDRTACDFDLVLGRRSRRRCCIAAVDRAGDVCAGNRDLVVVAVFLLRRLCLAGTKRGNFRIAAERIRIATTRHGDLIFTGRIAHLRDAAVDIPRSERW